MTPREKRRRTKVVLWSLLLIAMVVSVMVSFLPKGPAWYARNYVASLPTGGTMGTPVIIRSEVIDHGDAQIHRFWIEAKSTHRRDGKQAVFSYIVDVRKNEHGKWIASGEGGDVVEYR